MAAAAIWGREWSGQSIHFRSDNSAVVDAPSSRSARDATLSYLLHCIFFLEAYYQFEHSVSHIPKVLNRAADAISRDSLSTYMSVFPQASLHPVDIPLPLQTLLLNTTLSWTSSHWIELFTSTLLRAHSSVDCQLLQAQPKWRYLNFCNMAGVFPLPVTELSASQFVAHLPTQGLRAQSIAVYLSALRHLQVLAGVHNLLFALMLFGQTPPQAEPGPHTPTSLFFPVL